LEYFLTQNFFSKIKGNVASAKIITDRESGRSKGFGFVEMDDNTEASKAINALNGKMLKGRAMVVNESVKRN
jgi:RNA recognition motif-containing protein